VACLQQRGLNEAVQPGGDTQGSLPAAGFRDFDPFDRLRWYSPRSSWPRRSSPVGSQVGRSSGIIIPPLAPSSPCLVTVLLLLLAGAAVTLGLRQVACGFTAPSRPELPMGGSAVCACPSSPPPRSFASHSVLPRQRTTPSTMTSAESCQVDPHLSARVVDLVNTPIGLPRKELWLSSQLPLPSTAPVPGNLGLRFPLQPYPTGATFFGSPLEAGSCWSGVCRCHLGVPCRKRPPLLGASNVATKRKG